MMSGKAGLGAAKPKAQRLAGQIQALLDYEGPSRDLALARALAVTQQLADMLEASTEKQFATLTNGLTVVPLSNATGKFGLEVTGFADYEAMRLFTKGIAELGRNVNWFTTGGLKVTVGGPSKPNNNMNLALTYRPRRRRGEQV